LQVWVFGVENMRNTFLKDVRAAWNDSRVLFGRTKIMAKALGTTQEDEYQENMHKLSKVCKPLKEKQANCRRSTAM
jgi:mRNA turnover protein 4